MTGNTTEKIVQVAAMRTGRFLDWWIGELEEICRVVLMRFGFSARQVRIFELHGDDLDLVEGEQIFDLPDGRRAGKLRVPSTEYLYRKTNFPAAARPVLEAAVAQFARSVCPFCADDLLFGWKHVKEPGRQDGDLQIAICMVSAAKIAPALAAAKRQKVDLTHLVCGSRAMLIEIPMKGRGGQWTRVLTPPRLKFAALAALLIVSGAFLQIARFNQEREMLQNAMIPARQQLNEFRLASERIDEIRRRMELLNKGVSEASVTLILNELARVLPGEVHLSGFRYAEGEVTLDGIAQDATRLVPLLEEARIFKSANFTSPIRTTPDGTAQAFRLELEVAQDDL